MKQLILLLCLCFTFTSTFCQIANPGVEVVADTISNKPHFGDGNMGNGSAWFDDFAIEELPKVDTSASNQLIKFGKEVTDIVKRHSLYADSVNWNEVDKNIAELATSGMTMDDSPAIMDLIISKLRAAGDKHSLYQAKTTAQNYAVRNSVTEQPIARLINNNCGYIAVPAFASTSDTAGVNFATKIQQLIQDLDTKQTIKGWIVDLRQNGGGNMYPMIAGLGPLTGEGKLGYFVSPKAKNVKGTAWTYKHGSSGINGNKGVVVKKPYTLRNINNKIAVLIGSGTGSSGEMTVLGFVGKPNAKLFGTPTSGYITANQGFKLSTGAYMYLATRYVADRNQKIYKVNIQPDVTIASGKDGGADLALEAALQWLNE
ncbi:S41 family peptidase [Mucilaginibacter terrae]|uniref:Tail specific protease domain-containing protein n=1 Tax=Mucilaginibacter terrae TaxID=1955052 RepID=A0ABU3GYS3_9SPHI|nr:S41 family peptidase [Mucilaginibacter terrae]MDT3404756.1 hypothetical protein [Mucilaginibacter terrae]